MKRRVFVLAIGTVIIAGFVAATVLYPRLSAPQKAEAVTQASSSLVRFHSPVLGPVNAPVTIVEFFDPSCESCRAFFPYVKQIMAQYPQDVRLVIRYVLFHQGSEEAARLLETARLQGLYEPVLAAVLEAQPLWHDDAQAQKAWEAAAAVGLDVEAARATMNSPAIDEILAKDMADVKKVGVQGTPTFFVNGKLLTQFGPAPLLELVQSELQKVR